MMTQERRPTGGGRCLVRTRAHRRRGTLVGDRLTILISSVFLCGWTALIIFISVQSVRAWACPVAASPWHSLFCLVPTGIFFSSRGRLMRVAFFEESSCDEVALRPDPFVAIKGEREWKSIKGPYRQDWPNRQNWHRRSMYCLWKLTLEVAKTRPWELPFCGWQSASVTPWARPACVSKFTSCHRPFFSLLFTRKERTTIALPREDQIWKKSTSVA